MPVIPIGDSASYGTKVIEGLSFEHGEADREMNQHFARNFGIAVMVFLLALPTMATTATDSNRVANAPAMQDLHLRVGETLLRTLARIVELGWKPIRLDRKDAYEYSGIEKELVKRRFLELEGCSVDAGVLCIFYYSKLTRCLRVDTVGESIARITVTRWTEECPAAP